MVAQVSADLFRKNNRTLELQQPRQIADNNDNPFMLHSIMYQSTVLKLQCLTEMSFHVLFTLVRESLLLC